VKIRKAISQPSPIVQENRLPWEDSALNISALVGMPFHPGGILKTQSTQDPLKMQEPGVFRSERALGGRGVFFWAVRNARGSRDHAEGLELEDGVEEGGDGGHGRVEVGLLEGLGRELVGRAFVEVDVATEERAEDEPVAQHPDD